MFQFCETQTILLLTFYVPKTLKKKAEQLQMEKENIRFKIFLLCTASKVSRTQTGIADNRCVK